MLWFKELTGFLEESTENVHNHLGIKGDAMVSKVNGRSFQMGSLEIPSLNELRERNTLTAETTRIIQVSEIVGDVQKMHQDPENENALFQAASQFNLLEMVDPSVSPAAGINRYENDHTQGPACAIACGAGTIYRNYFVPLENQLGQTGGLQIDTLKDIGKSLGNIDKSLWKMSNGYALASQDGILKINKTLASLTPEEYYELQGRLQVGIQWNTEVTLGNTNHTVSQVYCSALPVAYSQLESYYWERFACLVLSATYEATLYAGLENYQKTGSKLVYLTLVGGGAFGNDSDWIEDAIISALHKFSGSLLDIRIVSYGASKESVRRICKDFQVD
ncbi:MAG: hypothetical protein ACI8Q1_001081 [Parvicella sp.]|jgi:hypothetical protein